MSEAVLSIRRPAVRLHTLLLGSLALCAAASVGYWAVEYRGWERTNDAFLEGHIVFLSPRVAGQVREVHVDENQHVRRGDLLVRLDPADFEARVARAHADLDSARNGMVKARAAADAASAQIAAEEVHLRNAEQRLARARQLFDRGILSQTLFDDAKAARDGAAAQLDAAQERERAERATLGNEAPLRQAEAALREAELALEHTEIRAPADGRIGKRSAEPGAFVSPGQPLIAFSEDAAVWVTANFKETQITAMRPGAAAEIRVDAFPDLLIRGRVESLAPATGAKYALLPPDNATGNFTKVVQRLPVRIAIDSIEGAAAGRPPQMAVGLSVNVRVQVD